MAASDWPVLAGQSFYVEKGPEWKTLVKEAASGRQLRIPLWSYPKWHFNVSYAVIRDRVSQNEIDLMWAFFCNQQGMGSSFNFLDPTDNVVTGGPTIPAAGDGSNRVFQLARNVTATVGAFTKSYIEPILAVNGATPSSVYKAGVSTGAYTLGANGVITFTVAPANGAVITWDGSFLFVCGFEQDDFKPAQMVKDLWSLDGGVKFNTVKV